MTTSVLTRRQRQILAALAEGQAIHMTRAFPSPTRYRLGPDFLAEDDVRKLVHAGLIEPSFVMADGRRNLNEATYRITDAGRAHRETAGAR